jgi:hypothetical protein
MAEPTIGDIRVLQERSLPTITLWNRLEGRPRTHDVDRALRAAVHDPLWMLTKQWQTGEFRGDDAGSPVFAKIRVDVARLDGYRPGPEGDAQPLDYEVPLEAQVEARPIPFEREGRFLALDVRLLMGRQWLKLLRADAELSGDFDDLRSEFLGRYPVERPDPSRPAHAAVCADADAWQHVAAVAGRVLDGYELYAHVKRGGSPHDGTEIPERHHARLRVLGGRFAAWFEALYRQPEGDDNRAWLPDRLEYHFAVSAPDATGRNLLAAEQYHHGRLDWYSVDVDPRPGPRAPGAAGTPPGVPRPNISFIPTPVRFEGMPESRWWTFDDARTNLGDVRPGTKDLAKLMLIGLGLDYANDWFLLPLTLPVGSATRITGMAVTDVFGDRTWIEPAGRGADQEWERWSMFTLAASGADDGEADLRFLLLPTVPKIQDGEPLEEVALIRDETANMVWGIETRVPLPHGRSRPGQEAALDLERFLEDLGRPRADEPPAAAAPTCYTVMSNTVPGNWIPFIPVHVLGDNREIQLQRAALPRTIPGAARPEKIRPRTSLLGEGRATNAAYFLHEEEVPRAGVYVRQSFQRTRWHGGAVVTWFGVQKQTGRGEGLSNLRFDYLTPALHTER